MTSSLVSATFLHAFIRRNNPKGLLFHSDQGTQYTSHAFSNRFRELGVTQSLSKAGYPYDNAVIESFFASLKKEEIYRTEYESIVDLRSAVDSYIHFYNEYWPHYSLNNRTPEMVERQYYSQRKQTK